EVEGLSKRDSETVTVESCCPLSTCAMAEEVKVKNKDAQAIGVIATTRQRRKTVVIGTFKKMLRSLPPRKPRQRKIVLTHVFHLFWPVSGLSSSIILPSHACTVT